MVKFWLERGNFPTITIIYWKNHQLFATGWVYRPYFESCSDKQRKKIESIGECRKALILVSIYSVVGNLFPRFYLEDNDWNGQIYFKRSKCFIPQNYFIVHLKRYYLVLRFPLMDLKGKMYLPYLPIARIDFPSRQIGKGQTSFILWFYL